MLHRECVLAQPLSGLRTMRVVLHKKRDLKVEVYMTLGTVLLSELNSMYATSTSASVS